MGYITRSWPRRPSPFPAAEKDHAEEERRDHEYLKNNKQKRINAAAAPDALKVSTLAWRIVAAPANAEESLFMGAASVAPKKINVGNCQDFRRFALQ